MRPPEVGQVLVASDGQQFFVTDVDPFDEADEQGGGFLVTYVLNRADIDNMAALAIELDHIEFEEMCRTRGIRY